MAARGLDAMLQPSMTCRRPPADVPAAHAATGRAVPGDCALFEAVRQHQRGLQGAVQGPAGDARDPHLLLLRGWCAPVQLSPPGTALPALWLCRASAGRMCSCLAGCLPCVELLLAEPGPGLQARSRTRTPARTRPSWSTTSGSTSGRRTGRRSSGRGRSRRRPAATSSLAACCCCLLVLAGACVPMLCCLADCVLGPALAQCSALLKQAAGSWACLCSHAHARLLFGILKLGGRLYSADTVPAGTLMAHAHSPTGRACHGVHRPPLGACTAAEIAGAAA